MPRKSEFRSREVDMGTVIRRTFRSSPYRNAQLTWAAIVDLLTQSTQSDAEKELEAVAGIAASCIADQSPISAPIIVTCDGPRTRIYCIYNDDAIDGADANENTLGFDPLNGEWAVSLPCENDDLQWVQSALKIHSIRVTARDLNSRISEENNKRVSEAALTLDERGFLDL